MDKRYIARPYHLYTLVLPMLVLGAILIGFGWFIFGVITGTLGVGLAVWIMLLGFWQGHSEYLSDKAYNMKSLAESAKLLDKVKDPNVWAAMGYEMPAPALPARVEHPHPEAPNRLPTLAFPKPPCTEPEMRLFANAVLRGSGMGEGEWAGPGKPFSPKPFRTLKDWLEHPDRAYIRRIDPAHPTKGFTRTKKGTEFFLYYADPEVKMMYNTFDRGEPDLIPTTPQGLLS